MRDRGQLLAIGAAALILGLDQRTAVRALSAVRLNRRRPDPEPPRIPAERLGQVASDAKEQQTLEAAHRTLRKERKTMSATLSGAYGWEAQQRAWDAAFPRWRGLIELVRHGRPAGAGPMAPEDRAFLDEAAALLRANDRFLQKPWQALIRAYNRHTK